MVQANPKSIRAVHVSPFLIVLCQQGGDATKGKPTTITQHLLLSDKRLLSIPIVMFSSAAVRQLLMQDVLKQCLVEENPDIFLPTVLSKKRAAMRGDKKVSTPPVSLAGTFKSISCLQSGTNSWS